MQWFTTYELQNKEITLLGGVQNFYKWFTEVLDDVTSLKL
jgi:hypothetical protein